MRTPNQIEKVSTTPDKIAHTPGPWHVDPRGEQDEIYCRTDDRPIAICSRHRVEHSSNARLIAAAPELLETVKAVLAILNQPWKDCDGPKTLQIAKADCEIARRYLDAAISKAEGK